MHSLINSELLATRFSAGTERKKRRNILRKPYKTDSSTNNALAFRRNYESPQLGQHHIIKEKLKFIEQLELFANFPGNTYKETGRKPNFRHPGNLEFQAGITQKNQLTISYIPLKKHTFNWKIYIVLIWSFSNEKDITSRETPASTMRLPSPGIAYVSLVAPGSVFSPVTRIEASRAGGAERIESKTRNVRNYGRIKSYTYLLHIKATLSRDQPGATRTF